MKEEYHTMLACSRRYSRESSVGSYSVRYAETPKQTPYTVRITRWAESVKEEGGGGGGRRDESVLTLFCVGLALII